MIKNRELFVEGVAGLRMPDEVTGAGATDLPDGVRAVSNFASVGSGYDAQTPESSDADSETAENEDSPNLIENQSPLPSATRMERRMREGEGGGGGGAVEVFVRVEGAALASLSHRQGRKHESIGRIEILPGARVSNAHFPGPRISFQFTVPAGGGVPDPYFWKQYQTNSTLIIPRSIWSDIQTVADGTQYTYCVQFRLQDLGGATNVVVTALSLIQDTDDYAMFSIPCSVVS